MNRPRSRRRRRHSGPRSGPTQGYGHPQEGAPQANANLATLEHRCVRQFPRIALSRGREYFNSGRISDPTWSGNECVLQVKGAGGSYRVAFDFSQVTEAQRLPSTCDCPAYTRGVLCKHLWAALLQIDKATPEGVIPSSGLLKLIHANPRPPGQQNPAHVQGGGNGRPVHHHHPHPAHPQVRSGGGVAGGYLESSGWIDRLNLIQGLGSASASRVISANSLAYFVIAASETGSTGKIVLDLWTRHRSPYGQLGPLRPSRVAEDFSQFADQRDQEVLSLLVRSCKPEIFAPFGRASGNISSRFTVDPLFESHLISLLAGRAKLFLSRSPNGTPDSAERPLRMDRGKPWELELKIEPAGPEHYRLGALLKREGETRNLTDPIAILRSGYVLFGDRIERFNEPGHALWALNLREPPEFLIPRTQADQLLTRILLDSSAPKVTWPTEMGWTQVVIEPRPKGVFRPLGNDPSLGRMTLTVSFDYEGREVALSENESTFVDVTTKRIFVRNRDFEEKTLLQALEILRDPQGTGSVPNSDLHRAAQELCQAGWNVYIENQQLRLPVDFSMNVSSSTDWFDLKLEASFGAADVSRADLIAALESKSGMVKLADGSLGMLPQDWLERYASITQFGEKTEDGSFRFNRSQGLMLNSALKDDDRLRADSTFLTFRDRVKQFEGVEAAKAPKGFKGSLRNYQKEGLTWLNFLEAFETGGILADDMGLGKTIQILAFLLSRAKERKAPSIVVTPKSLAFNWMDEAERFAPGLKIMRYTGTGRAQQIKNLQAADLVVTTYGTLRADIEKLREIEFDIAVVDEAQAIKNPKSQSAMASKMLRARHRLALTGTPIENSINDLLSILEFTNPGLLSLSQQQKEGGKDIQGTLAKMLKPFMLRRTKEKVLTELPDKSEQVLYCEMSAEEKQFYTAIRDHYRQSLTEKIERSGIGRNKIHVLEALLRLRQVACHSGLVDPERKAAPSAKLQLLVNHLQEITQEGHKALVFSQFTSLLALVRSKLDEEKVVYEYLDGQTEDRKAPVERFQTDPKCQVFLISLKAGGTGLNLTAADYVFILDPWWNPAVEAQAIGRAHRMGQSQKVFAYRMIAKGTVEEKILELQKTKKELAESIISEDQDFMKKLSREDLEMLLE